MSTTVISNNSLFWTETLAKELLLFLTGRVKCPETAADLTHETYLRSYQSINNNPPDNARALAFRIAVNLAIDYQRKTNVRKRHHADVEIEAVAETVAGSAITEPLEILLSQQRFSRLQTALEELPEDCRSAFLFNGRDGLSYSEIAERMNISKSKVGRLIAQAMVHCSAHLDE